MLASRDVGHLHGNLTARGADAFGYDQANRLKTASVAGVSSSYAYDGDGKRSSKSVACANTAYTYDVNASLPVLLDDGVRKYVWGLGLAYAVDTSANPILYHQDGLGSVRALTDSSGSVVQTYLYDECGVVTSSQGSVTQPFQYTGEQRDPETGLVYLRARYYEAGAGRFLQRDSVSGSIRDVTSLHRFGYVRNNPLMFVDPSGHAARDALDTSLPQSVWRFGALRGLRDFESPGRQFWKRTVV